MERGVSEEPCRMPEPATNPAGWEHFPHVADIGVHGYGPTLAAAFEQAALALSGIVTDPQTIAATSTVSIHCGAPDIELLLADWLNAIVFEMDTRRMLFGFFKVHIDGTALHGKARGEPIDVKRHRPSAEPKGATLSELRVHQDPAGTWHARCVVDV